MQLKFLDTALADLVALRAHIARENPTAAGRVATRIRSRIDAVVENPLVAPLAPDIPNVRRLAVTGTPYLVFYRVVEARGRIEILRVLHGAQQWPPRNGEGAA